MPLAPGTKLGPYEIVSPLGAGGMGEVYRARDTRLGRDVAVKVLPADVAASAGSRERFEREAQVISSLQHRNICTLHDVGRDGDTDFLVMELLDGESLAARIERGPLKLDETIRIGGEIAMALDAAHRAGIVHRDLKPGNVMLTRGGAKVLDFGIAKLAEPEGATPGRLPTMTPTRTTPLTSKGALMGTLNYMAPEQLEGRDVDSRADIFALGAVLYEMITGRRAFDGASQASVIAAILERDPVPVATLAPAVPAALDRLVRACLAKDPDARRQSARDIASELREIGESPTPITGEIAIAPRGGRGFPWVVSVIAILLAVALAAVLLRPSHADAPSRVIEIAVPSRIGIAAGGQSTVAVSPDGAAVAFSDSSDGGLTRRVFIRRIDDAVAKLVEGTDGAGAPFWSPDGREIGYFTRGKLMAVPVGGGRPRDLCDVAYGVGGTWGANGIVFSSSFNEGLRLIDPQGGHAEQVTTLDAARKESGHVWPQFLPDGKRFLYLSRSTAEESSRIELGSIEKKPPQVVLEADAIVGYAAPWLLFVRGGVMFAQRFDPATGTVSGTRHTLVDDTRYSESWATAGASVSGDTVAWLPHRPVKIVADWYGAAGTPTGRAFEDDDVHSIRISPDGTRVALNKLEPSRGSDDLWVLELARGLSTRLTKTDGDDEGQCWAADGSSLVFTSDQNGPYAIYRVAADGSGPPVRILGDADHDLVSQDVSKDGRTVFFVRESGAAHTDIWSGPVDAPDRGAAWLETSDDEAQPRISPDGRWVAFTSSRSARGEVYARRVDGGTVAQLSVDGGSGAVWEPDGRAVRYLGRDGHLRRVPLRIEGDRLVPGATDRAAEIAEDRIVAYDIAPDGRLLLLREASQPELGFVMRLGWKTKLAAP